MKETPKRERKWLGVEGCELVRESCGQNSDDDPALFVKQFKRVFKNKEKDGKWSVSLQSIVENNILKRITKVMLEKEIGACQRCLVLTLHVEEMGTMLLNVLT